MRRAIIDIGYNAIRAVVYENDQIGAPEIFNNKFKSDILNLLSYDSIDVKHQTYLSIQYLLNIFNKLEVSNIKCVATAVLRDHPRAQVFIDYIKNKYSLDINIISGKEEATLTAKGLISGIQDTNGLAIDLGGGSLELIEIKKGIIGKLDSLELGTKVISSKKISDVNKIIEIITTTFGSNHYKNIYFIGGALRFIGKLYIESVKYPIKNLHNLEIPTREFISYIEKVKVSLNKKKSNIGKRKINQNAILVTEAIIKLFTPEAIIISTYGLKEGVRVDSLGYNNINIIEEKIIYTCNYDIAKTDFNNYFNLFKSLMDNPPGIDSYRDLLKYSIMLMSLRYQFDKTIPPKAISEYILGSEIPFKHETRIMLALILVYALNHKPDLELLKNAKILITKEELAISKIIGYFLQISEEIDGPIFIKPSFSITAKNNYLEISDCELLPRPIFEKVYNNLKSIAYSKKIHSN